MRREHLWEIGGRCQWIIGIEKMVVGLGLRIPGCLRNLEEILKSGQELH